jgi:hypothetical protein
LTLNGTALMHELAYKANSINGCISVFSEKTQCSFELKPWTMRGLCLEPRL